MIFKLLYYQNNDKCDSHKILHSDKDHTVFSLWDIPKVAPQSKMAGGRHLEKKDKLLFSATVPPISTKFWMMTHVGPPNPKRCLENQVFKNPRWWTAAILKVEKSLYHQNRLADFDIFVWR